MNEIRPGAKLKMLIQSAGYTLKDFASKVGMSRETLHRKLNSAIMDHALVTKAAEVLQLEESEIIGDAIRVVSEPQAPYGDYEIAALRKEVADLKRQISDLAQRDDLSREMMEVIKALTKKE